MQVNFLRSFQYISCKLTVKIEQLELQKGRDRMKCKFDYAHFGVTKHIRQVREEFGYSMNEET